MIQKFFTPDGQTHFAYAVYRDAELILCNPLFRAYAGLAAWEEILPDGEITQPAELPTCYAIRHAFSISGQQYSLLTFLVFERAAEETAIEELKHAVRDVFFHILSYTNATQRHTGQYAVKTLLARLREMVAEKFSVAPRPTWMDPYYLENATSRFVWDGLIMAFCMLLPARVVEGRAYFDVELQDMQLYITFHFGYGVEDSFRPALARAIGRACGFAITCLADGLILQLSLIPSSRHFLGATSLAQDLSWLAFAAAMERDIACAQALSEKP